jgi:threonine dehydrogenase-like Zn-dependent dehydrogenase
MRAVRLTGPKRLDLVELPDPEPEPGEIVLRVAASGICGSDLSCYKTGVFSGSVLGHEFSGVVERSDADGFLPGTPVLVDPKMPCGECADCRGGSSYRCTQALTRGPGGMRDGGFAELVAVPASCLHPLPDGLRVEDGCLTEPLAVAIHGIERAGGVTPGQDVVVIGLGPIGLLAVAALRAKGAGTVTGVDPVAVRRHLAERLGAAATAERLSDAPNDASLVLECSGRADILQDAINLAAAGGRVGLLGVPIDNSSVTAMVWVVREVTVSGAIASSPDDFRASAELLVKEPGIAQIITRRVGLDGTAAAFEQLVQAPADGKVAVEPNRVAG